MIIRGGQVQIFERDTLPTVTITDAVVIVELPKNASMNDYAEYLTARVGPGSSITWCTFRSIEYWAEQEAAESISWAIANSKVPAPQLPPPASMGWSKYIRHKLGL